MIKLSLALRVALLFPERLSLSLSLLLLLLLFSTKS